MSNEATGAEPMWDEQQTANFLNLAPKTLANDRVSGRLQIPFYKLNAAVRYSPAEVREWLAARRRVSTTDPGPEPTAG